MKKEIITSVLLLGALGTGFLTSAFGADEEWSLSERRRLNQMPALSAETVMDGSFMEKFETYTQDQFPLREVFRNLKAQVQYYILQQRDNNGIYMVDGSLSKLESNLSESSVAAVAEKINALTEQYFAESRVFYGVIPDKNYYLARAKDYPHLNYERLNTILAETVDADIEYVSLYDCLDAADYYRTDSHWRQECLEPVAQRIGETLGVSVAPFADYTTHTFENFCGVYWGQSALNLPGEDLHYLTSAVLDGCTVYHVETGKETGVYETEKLEGRDPYDVFLGGADAITVITNPAAKSGRELILFRDSFGSSLAPLLAAGYDTVTLVDLRYVSSKILDQFIDFHGQDVLFLYSPSVYNSFAMLK